MLPLSVAILLLKLCTGQFVHCQDFATSWAVATDFHFLSFQLLHHWTWEELFALTLFLHITLWLQKVRAKGASWTDLQVYSERPRWNPLLVPKYLKNYAKNRKNANELLNYLNGFCPCYFLWIQVWSHNEFGSYAYGRKLRCTSIIFFGELYQSMSELLINFVRNRHALRHAALCRCISTGTVVQSKKSCNSPDLLESKNLSYCLQLRISLPF